MKVERNRSTSFDTLSPQSHRLRLRRYLWLSRFPDRLLKSAILFPLRLTPCSLSIPLPSGFLISFENLVKPTSSRIRWVRLARFAILANTAVVPLSISGFLLKSSTLSLVSFLNLQLRVSTLLYLRPIFRKVRLWMESGIWDPSISPALSPISLSLICKMRRVGESRNTSDRLLVWKGLSWLLVRCSSRIGQNKDSGPRCEMTCLKWI